ncbi:hypothetical protein BU14_0231s0009 [Porphyra umbilicalis]|uniref:Uncharacterized protein n=1 Tax=Porphyra umbilicalis TaxID=2786 RepID=A0A1X6P455_PORUM|nr:hypothetical protein BU14_0231s0009 [Porphyra umbilicalis]|eukprot:OSX75556.1 hypothetical protein BU14_0231s0009 [Porphyra umbilicalis]
MSLASKGRTIQENSRKQRDQHTTTHGHRPTPHPKRAAPPPASVAATFGALFRDRRRHVLGRRWRRVDAKAPLELPRADPVLIDGEFGCPTHARRAQHLLALVLAVDKAARPRVEDEHVDRHGGPVKGAEGNRLGPRHVDGEEVNVRHARAREDVAQRLARHLVRVHGFEKLAKGEQVLLRKRIHGPRRRPVADKQLRADGIADGRPRLGRPRAVVVEGQEVLLGALNEQPRPVEGVLKEARVGVLDAVDGAEFHKDPPMADRCFWPQKACGCATYSSPPPPPSAACARLWGDAAAAAAAGALALTLCAARGAPASPSAAAPAAASPAGGGSGCPGPTRARSSTGRSDTPRRPPPAPPAPPPHSPTRGATGGGRPWPPRPSPWPGRPADAPPPPPKRAGGTAAAPRRRHRLADGVDGLARQAVGVDHPRVAVPAVAGAPARVRRVLDRLKVGHGPIILVAVPVARGGRRRRRHRRPRRRRGGGRNHKRGGEGGGGDERAAAAGAAAGGKRGGPPRWGGGGGHAAAPVNNDAAARRLDAPAMGVARGETGGGGGGGGEGGGRPRAPTARRCGGGGGGGYLPTRRAPQRRSTAGRQRRCGGCTQRRRTAAAADTGAAAPPFYPPPAAAGGRAPRAAATPPPPRGEAPRGGGRAPPAGRAPRPPLPARRNPRRAPAARAARRARLPPRR